MALDGVFLEYIKENLPDPSKHKIYFDHGTEGLDTEYEPFQDVVDRSMSIGLEPLIPPDHFVGMKTIMLLILFLVSYIIGMPWIMENYAP